MDTNVKSGVYKHFKNGQVYVITTAKHSDREETEVVYLGLNNGKCYARPIESFMEQVKNAEGNIVPRFTEASPEESAEIMANLSEDVKAHFKNLNNTFCL